MMEKARGFCLYNPDGSILRLIHEESEMQSVFSTVLAAFEKEQRERFGKPPEERNETTSSNDDNGNAPSAESSAVQAPPDGLSSTSAAAEQSSQTGSSNGHSATSTQPPATVSTRRSRRGSEEGLVSLTYSYGSLEWDAIAMCWKPSTAKRRKSNGSKAKTLKRSQREDEESSKHVKKS